MKAKDVIGKRIKEIVQRKFRDERGGGFGYDLLSIVLEDGSRISISAQESDTDPWVFASYVPPPKKGKA